MNYKILKSTPGASVDKKTRILTQFALAVGAFAIGTAEFVSMGLLPEMAKATQVDIPTAGHYISSYALGVVVGAPVLAVATAKIPRKVIIIALMLFYTLANILSGFAGQYNSLMIMRFLSGLPHGIFFGVASVAVSAMVSSRERPKAIGNVVLGLTVAIVIGAPAATWLGQVASWSVAFTCVGLISALCAVLVWLFMPFTPTAMGISPLTELGALKKIQVWLMLGVVAVGTAGMFTVFSYIKPILIDVSGYDIKWVPYIMPLVGVGMVTGNLIGPRLSYHLGLMKTIFYSMLITGFLYLLFYYLTAGRLSVAIGCFLVGLSFASMPSIQTRIMDSARKAQTLAGALVQSAYNMANALGAWAGGMAISAGLGYASTAILAVFFTFGGLLIFCVSWGLEKMKPTEHEEH